MSSTGQQLIAGRIPNERIETAIERSDSATITTTETVVMTVVAPVVIGRIYKVTIDAAFNLSVADDIFSARIREDSLAGTGIQVRRATASTGDLVQPITFGVEYTADVTENKTFVMTFDRSSGTGNIVLNASESFPSYLYVDYIRG